MTVGPTKVTPPTGAPGAGDGFIKVKCVTKLKPLDVGWNLLPSNTKQLIGAELNRSPGDEDVAFQGSPHAATQFGVPIIEGLRTLVCIGFKPSRPPHHG